MSNTRKDLERMVQRIADEITEGCFEVTEENADKYPALEIGDSVGAYDYFADALDVNYVTNSDKTYKAVRLLITFGGPNIWLCTDTMTVEGYWWGDRASASFNDNMGIDEAFEEVYQS